MAEVLASISMATDVERQSDSVPKMSHRYLLDRASRPLLWLSSRIFTTMLSPIPFGQDRFSLCYPLYQLLPLVLSYSSPLNESPVPQLTPIQVGINLTDATYRGFYRHSKPSHEDDLPQVLDRASSVGVRKFLVTGSDLEQSRQAIELSKHYPGRCYATVGVHPCSAMSFEKSPGGGEKLLTQIKTLAQSGKDGGHVKAFGEFGLDFDRLEHCSRVIQEKWFARQLDVAVEVHH